MKHWPNVKLEMDNNEVKAFEIIRVNGQMHKNPLDTPLLNDTVDSTALFKQSDVLLNIPLVSSKIHGLSNAQLHALLLIYKDSRIWEYTNIEEDELVYNLLMAEKDHREFIESIVDVQPMGKSKLIQKRLNTI